MADQVLYEVERLLDKKLEKKQVFYLVRWKNYSEEYDTWEPAKNLRACKSMFKDFAKKKKATKSLSVAAKLLKKSKVGRPPKVSSGKAKKGSHVAARQKIAEELRSKTKHLAKLGTVSADKKLPKKEKKTQKTVPVSGAPVNGATVAHEPGQSADNAKKSGMPSVKKKVKEQTEKGSAAKPAGTKRPSSTLIPGKKDSSVKKKIKADAAGTPKVKAPTTSTPKLNASATTSTPKLNTSGIKKKTSQASNDNGDLKTETSFKTGGKKTNSKSESLANKTSQSSSKLVHKNNSESSKSAPKTAKTGGKSKTSSLDQSLDDITIVSDSESDDDDVLYSLMDGVDTKTGWDDSTQKTVKEEASGCVIDKIHSSGGKISPKKNSHNSSTPNSATKRMSLIDFKKPKSSKQKPGTFEQLLRPSSPTPFFTPLKAAQSPLLGSLPTTSSLSMDSLVGDVPTFQAAPAGPLSPSAISYKTLLDSLPSQFHPKGKKKKENGNGASTSSGGSGQSVGGGIVAPEPIERRISVRAAECVFRYKQIVVKKLHRYTQIWLNTQTAMKNTFNPQVVQEVVAALNTAKYDDSCLVLFSGIGSFFCSGVDLHFLTTGDVRVAARQMADALRELTKAFITFPKPVIAAVGGSAVGLGVALLCLCDVVYASDKAAFHLPYARLSQTPEGCSSFTLPLNIGLAAANELLFGGRRITAMEAYQLGLVSHVFWPTAFMQEVIPRAQNMASCAPKVLEGTKLLIRSHHRTKMELTNETECNLLLERWASSECQRAMEAYLANENNFSS